MVRFNFLLLLLFLVLISQDGFGQLYYVNMESTSKWEQDFSGITKIKVYWENPSSYNYTQRQWVQEAVEDTWSKFANVDFVGWGAYDYSGQGIRIYIDDYAWPHTIGLGKQLDGVQSGMILSFDFLGEYKCNHSQEYCIKAIAVHEFGHALGIAHEQDRSDCVCNETPQDYSERFGSYYVTPCDLSSVMNYCNPKWNNGGELSAYDIEGIQAVYGIRKTASDYYENTGYSSAVDKLGNDQVWENLNLTLGDQQFIYNINASNPEEIKSFTFTESGTYNYVMSSTSLHTDGRTHYGYGSGSVVIDKTKNYKIEIFAKNLQNENFDIYVVATDIASVDDNIYEQGGTSKKKEDPPMGGYGSRFLRNGEKPISLVLLDNISFEKYYVYSDGTIMVYNKNSDTFFDCGQKQAPYYKDWNGKIWSWTFYRNIGNNLQETYTVSTTGEVWAMNTANEFVQFGYVTYVDF